MKRPFQLLLQPRRKAVYVKIILFFIGLGITSSLTLLPKLDRVEAGEIRANQIALNSDWQAASFPVENFQAYTSAYGYRRSATGGGGWEFHRGLDMAAPMGSYIRNWWGGTVTKVGDRGACGTNITIQSGEWEHVYCHMQGRVENIGGVRYLVDREGGIQVAVGQQIPAGVRIGRVGMTGRTTGPHLHWGLKYSNNYIDPAVVLREMYSQQGAATASATTSPTPSWNPQPSSFASPSSQYIRNWGY
ncbi:MAG: M23 family metallopeptidase [Nostocaceae cyanobacterium]|nr:M23 family metallopeptidase [Nostocaceae cyanobacterium]